MNPSTYGFKKLTKSLFLTGDITQKGYDKKRNKLLAPYMQQNKEQQLQQQQNKKPQPQVWIVSKNVLTLIAFF